LPYLKNKDKINKTNFLCKGIGILPTEYAQVLVYIKNYPKSTQKDISKALKKNKVYSELKILTDFRFISCEDYPHKFRVLSRGLKSIGGSKS